MIELRVMKPILTVGVGKIRQMNTSTASLTRGELIPYTTWDMYKTWMN